MTGTSSTAQPMCLLSPAPKLRQHRVPALRLSSASPTTVAVLLTTSDPKHLPTCASKNVYQQLFMPPGLLSVMTTLSLFVCYLSLFTSPMLIFMKWNSLCNNLYLYHHSGILTYCLLLLFFSLSSKLCSLMAKILKDLALYLLYVC